VKKFHWVKVWDPKVAKEFNIKAAGAVLYLDPDGDEVGRGWCMGTQPLKDSMERVGKKFAAKEIAWSDDLESSLELANKSRRLAVLGYFNDDRPSTEALKALGEPWLAKSHARFVWVRLSKEQARERKAAQPPCLAIVHPDKPDRTADRLLGWRPLPVLRDWLLAADKKFQDAEKKSK
jgi:hypothetical protein